MLYIVIQFFCFNGKPLTISKETTFITEPLLSSGKFVDYFKAVENEVYPKEMKTDDNGYRLIVQTLGVIDREDWADKPTLVNLLNPLENLPERVSQIYEKLGLEYDPDFKPTVKIESPKSFLQHLDPDGTKDLIKNYETFTEEHGYWTIQDFPQLETYINDNTAGLDILAAAVRKKTFCMPMVRYRDDAPLLEVMTPVEIETMRAFARAVQCRAFFRIGNGEIDKAIDDILTLHYFARHIVKQGPLFDGMVGLSFELTAHRVGINAHPKHPAAKEQLQRLLNEREKLPPLCSFDESMKRERMFCLGLLQDMSRGIIYNNVFERLPAIGDCHVYDYNEAMKVMNRCFDEAEKADADMDTYIEKNLRSPSSLWTIIKRFPTAKGRGQWVGTMMTIILVPAAFETGKNAWQRTDIQQDLMMKGTVQLIQEMKPSAQPATEVLLEAPFADMYAEKKIVFCRSGAIKIKEEKKRSINPPSGKEK
ncbi:MAG: hypothetical protein LBH00_06325 [Planctomycetaceae bacterium]|nr:hypothetical protein [Planctomycetaceae bacterium]